jgi:hypothetical protein
MLSFRCLCAWNSIGQKIFLGASLSLFPLLLLLQQRKILNFVIWSYLLILENGICIYPFFKLLTSISITEWSVCSFSYFLGFLVDVSLPQALAWPLFSAVSELPVDKLSSLSYNRKYWWPTWQFCPFSVHKLLCGLGGCSTMCLEKVGDYYFICWMVHDGI